MVNRVFVNTLCYFVDIMYLFSKSLCIVTPGGQLLNVTFSSRGQAYSMDRLYSDQSFMSLCHRRHVVWLCMLYKVNSNFDHSLFCEPPDTIF